jgi:acetyl-CoA carboxylase carboxyl transferase subunit alpha
MLENSIYSVVSPRGFASILWKDASKEKEATEILHITAQDLLSLEVCEAIIDEPVGGAHTDLYKMSENIKEYLVKITDEKMKKTLDVLLNERYTKFRKIGQFEE